MKDDTISRQAAIDEVVAWLKDRMTDGKNGKPLTDRIKDLPSAQPERKKGEWRLFDEPRWYCCSECGAVRRQISFMENFCPNCGADMRGENNEID